MTASVHTLMPRLRLLLVVLFGALVFASSASAATRSQILNDCEDDDMLSRTYKPTELRDARNNIDSDLDTYSKCRDVISAALAPSSRGGAKPPSAAGPAATALPGGATPAPGAGPSQSGRASPKSPKAAAAPTAIATVGPGAAGKEAKPTREELADLARARRELPEIDVRGQRVVPGVRSVAGTAASVPVPTSLIVVLVLLALTVVLGTAPVAVRRVRARRSA